MSETNPYDVISFPGFDPFKLSTYVPTYGKYCGPSWTAGQRVEGKVSDELFDLPPSGDLINGVFTESQVDTACREHDRRYNNAIGASDEALQVLQADIQLMQDFANFDWSLMSATEKTYAVALAASFTLKIAAVDTPTSAFESLKNEASLIASNLFSNPEFDSAFRLHSSFTDDYGDSMDCGYDTSGNIFLSFSKSLNSNTELNATFLGQDVSSMFNTNLIFSPKTDFALTTTDSDGNQTISSLTIYEGDYTAELANSGLIAADAIYTDGDGNLVSPYDSLFKIENSDGNSFTLVKDQTSVTLKDGTTATINTILSTLESAQLATEKFISGYMYQITSIFTTGSGIAGLISDINAGIEKGESIEQIAKTVALKALVETAGQQIKNSFLLSESDSELFRANPSLAMANNNGVALTTEGTMSQAGQDAINNFAVNHPVYNTAYLTAVSMATTMLLNHEEGWDSQEYTRAAAEATAQAAAQTAIQVAVQKGFFGSGITAGAGAVGAGAAAAYMISASINDIFADDHMNSHEWQSTMVSAGIVGVASFAGFMAAAYLIGASIAGPIGAVVASIIVSQFMGGKEYGPGEYPDPYSYLNITPKADGTGNIIQGTDPQGVVAIAREYYHDDIYGTSGSDNLIGKSGTNTILGYSGNDHLEGRGDIDLLIGGEGDDEIFGGNGDDKIYGSEGKDNLFGGNGDDIIIGDTGSSITNATTNSADYADFIQGGSGADQIMGEYGDDEIQGNDGDDIILGGAGDDRIEGNDGDDSILGEDGDDTILAGAGSDIIDGGAGIDIIQGNEGNDNIHGGDGADEIYGNEGIDIIYGDEGNDLINSGSEDDLAFGGLGNDIIYGGDGNDSLSGELGNDYVIGADGDDIIDGGAGDDVLFGGTGADTITTGIGNDTIIFRSGDGQDIIDESATIISFGAENIGNDIIRLSDISSLLADNSTNRLVLSRSGDDLLIQINNDSGSLTTDQITITNQFSADGPITKKIEFADDQYLDLTSLTLTDGESLSSYGLQATTNIDTAIQEELALGYNDLMQVSDEQINPASTYSANNYSTSGEQDQIDFEKYNEVQWRSMKKKRNIFGGYYTVWYKYYEYNLGGTNGNDRIVGHWWGENIYGGNGNDQLHGDEGSDYLNGGPGDDILHGGTGDDRAYGESGADLIYGGSGNDYLDGGSDNDSIYGNAGIDNILGGSGDDYLEGNADDDSISDDEGNNIIIGGAGLDTINTGAGADKIEGNDGDDVINSDAGNDLIYGNDGFDKINSGDGNDTIYGQEGGDLISAGAGDDYVSGGSGDDLINGEDGNDTLFGDLGSDLISGGTGSDYIYGGANVDILSGDDGDDMIKGGDSDDFLDGGTGNDKLYGESGSDRIYGDEGDDEISGGNSGDVLEGDEGNDILNGGNGNDILVDGTGSDTLDGGADSDIIILTKESGSSSSIDTVKNFNKSEDKIILKINYQTPITFADIQSNMVQNGANIEINLDNGQKIIIENTNISDITSNNFQIGLSGGANNDILFGTDGEDIIFGDEGDDKIYGGEGNDELWGGKGSDELYGEGGDDILRYEGEGKYLETKSAIFFDERVSWYWHTRPYSEIKQYSPELGTILQNESVDQSSDVIIFSYRAESRKNILPNEAQFEDYLNVMRALGFYGGLINDEMASKLATSAIDLPDGQAYDGYLIVERCPRLNIDNEILPSRLEWEVLGGDIPSYADHQFYRIDYEYSVTAQFNTKNFYNSSYTDITGYNRSFDKFDGGSGYNVILMTEGNDVLALDDTTSASGSDEAGASTSARVKDISVIHAGAGDDVINFSTKKYSYSDVIIYGGTGSDKIWSNSGNDQIFSGEGDDEIFSGEGSDSVVGGAGDDVIYSGSSNDTLEGGSGTNQLFGEDGDDTIIAGAGSDIIDGGAGSDTISYINSNSAVIIDLSTNSLSGGDAGNDIISSIENITASAFNDILTGDSSDNIFNGNGGDDIINGGAGSDTYIYNQNSGTDTITESGTDIDAIEFGPGIAASDLTFTANNDDLEIQIGSDSSNKIILKNQASSERVELLKFSDDNSQQVLLNSNLGNPLLGESSWSQIEISQKFFIANEDQQLIFDNPLEENPEERRRFEQISASFGTIIFDEIRNRFLYQSSENFHGIDEITLSEESGDTSKFTVFVNNVNDSPLSIIPSEEVKVEEEFSINLRDYLSDADGDEVTLSLSLKGFNSLPDWINFDEESGVLSGKSGRDGKLNFTVTASDGNGASISNQFYLKIARKIIDDIIPTTPVEHIMGTDGNDILRASANSSDIITAGAGDDIIEYVADQTWQQIGTFSYNAWNIYSGDEVSITGKLRSFDGFDGGTGYDILNLTDGDDAIFLDDVIVSNLGEISKLSSIEEINAGDGNDAIDLTSLTFEYDDVTINGGAGDDLLWSGAGNDILDGGAGDDNLQSGTGDDIIKGGEGDDIIKAYDGDDQITGGKGFDVMIGGDGNDQFIFSDIADSIGFSALSSFSKTDLILDFVSGEDKINLSGLGFDSISEGQGSNASTNGLEFYFDGSGNTIIDDPNSNFAIKLAGEIQLGVGDFIMS